MLWSAAITRLFVVFRQRSAGAAMIVALSFPLLIGATGLCVDVGYWYQQQEALQSAADAAAIGAALNDPIDPTNNAAAAVSAANSATNHQFSFDGTSVTISSPTTYNAGVQFIVTATAKIPRGSFFSKKGGPLFGIGAGYQYASATATIYTKTVQNTNGCLISTNTTAAAAITVTGNGQINANGCNDVSYSSACDGVNGIGGAGNDNGAGNAVYAAGGQINGNIVAAAGCTWAVKYQGTINGGSGIGTNVIQHDNVPPDPLANLQAAPQWPGMPPMQALPTQSTALSALMPTMPAFNAATPAPSSTTLPAPTPKPVNTYLSNAYQTASGSWGSCDGNGNCTLSGSASISGAGTSSPYTAIASGIKSLAFNYTGGTAYILGGISGNTNAGISFNDSNNYYYINGAVSTGGNGGAVAFGNSNYYLTNGLSIGTSSAFTGTGTGYYISGGTSISNAATTLGAGNYYLYGPSSSSCTTGLGLNVSNGSSAFSLGASSGSGNYYISGGAAISTSSSSATYLGSGTGNTYDLFGASSAGATNCLGLNVSLSGSSFTMGSGNYNILGGMSVTSTATTLGSGTYYVTGQPGSGAITSTAIYASGTSFSLGASGTGSYYIDGGISLSNPAATFGAGNYTVYGTQNSSGYVNGYALTVGGSTPSVSIGTNGTQSQNFNYYFNGGVDVTQNSTLTYGPGTYFMFGSANSTGTVTGTAFYYQGNKFTGNGGTYYINGGMLLSGNPTLTFGQGTYLFSKPSGSSHGAFDNSGSGTTINFTGGTYYFDGGFTAEAATNVTFGPGIYYIRNGNLSFASGSTVTANGATFVLEGTAGYNFSGGNTNTLSAPVQSADGTACVEPVYNANYANALVYNQTTSSKNYTTTSTATSNAPTLPTSQGYPFDATDGVGICGVLIYQARGDTTADTISEGANSTFTGIIYAPSAALTVSGGASISAASSAQTLAFIQNTFTLSGSGKINLSVGTSDPELTESTTTVSQPILTN